ncbi:MAG: hypothetical protein RR626_01745, partial [Anaerovoracaceae bacterium]
EESWSVIASMETLDEAAEAATEAMFEFLKTRVSLPEPELVMLMSMVGNLEICQVVDPLKTVRFVMAKNTFNQNKRACSHALFLVTYDSSR